MGRIENASWNGKKTYVIILLLSSNGISNANNVVMRLGKPLEHLQAALRAALTTGPVEETLTIIARQVGYFGYLTYDAIVWVRPGF